MSEDEDIEELYAEARSGYTPTPEEHWQLSASIANLIVRGAPGSTVKCGDPRSRQVVVDYITPLPKAPLNVFGPDGRFIVSFFEDGSWMDALGMHSDARFIIEGGPGDIARNLLENAGIDPRAEQSELSARTRTAHTDDLPRLLTPSDTRTWRDEYAVARSSRRDSSTPPSICRKSSESRLILATYEPDSCTYSSGYRDDSRWGVESLRVPVIIDEALRYGFSNTPSEIHEGDCLVTLGYKRGGLEGELEFDGEDDRGKLLWHPQEVIHVEPEGANFVRVWLIVDHDVANDHVDPSELGIRAGLGKEETRVLKGQERQAILEEFNLDVFCTQCGNRARPIVYGMPNSMEPSYLILGGCTVEPGQPEYECSCGHQWSGDQLGIL